MVQENTGAGFHGYGIASIYPNWGSGVNQNQETIMEPEEQALVADVGKLAQPAVNPNNRKNIWIAVGVIVGVILLSSKG